VSFITQLDIVCTMLLFVETLAMDTEHKILYLNTSDQMYPRASFDSVRWERHSLSQNFQWYRRING
jgi:hypothetical protein